MDSERRRQSPLVRDEHVEATAFLHEIIMTADALREARAFDGDPAMHFDPISRVLRAIERCGGAPTFTDLGRLLGISRQAARGHALEAATQGVVELFQAPDDRRAWQVALTTARALRERSTHCQAQGARLAR
jgi:DNA-binding MarR family transcriptional regulator